MRGCFERAVKARRGGSLARLGFSVSSRYVAHRVECVFWRERSHLFKMNGIGDGTMANEVVLTDATTCFNAN